MPARHRRHHPVGRGHPRGERLDPHLHTLQFLTGDPGAAGLAALVLHFRDKWRKYITGQGYRPPDDLHGVKVDRCKSTIRWMPRIAGPLSSRPW
jgi:hypothetical protein